ncbi:MAG: esterase [Clostridia bacterium]|nr:esterase [Clostridia bacterium]
MLTEERLNGIRCFFYKTEGAADLLVQAVDAHDLEGLEQEIHYIRGMTGHPFSLAAFLADSWNDALSPWPAPPVFGRKGFGGQAPQTLASISDTLLPYAKAQLEPARLYLGGYSLSGLFALWAACQTDVFCGIAACSPSVWFPGWDTYSQSRPVRAPWIYLSLGDREERTRNQTMARVGDCLRGQYALLQKQPGCKACTLEWNPGNHFMDAPLRTAKGFAWLLNQAHSRGTR